MLISQTDSYGSLYFLTDAQNSTRSISNEAGAITSSYRYDAFGNLDESIAPETVETYYLYTGQQFDPETELYSLRARYYDPSLGRFLSRDTWAYDYQNPFELNRYVYTANNPVKYEDPSGNEGTIGYALQVGGKAAAAGGLIGGFVGFISSSILYWVIQNGGCGEKAAGDLRASGVSWADFVIQGTVTGAFYGAAGGFAIGFSAALGYGLAMGINPIDASLVAGHFAGVATAVVGGIQVGIQSHATLLDPNICNKVMLGISIGASVAGIATTPAAFTSYYDGITMRGTMPNNTHTQIPVETEDGLTPFDDLPSLNERTRNRIIETMPWEKNYPDGSNPSYTDGHYFPRYIDRLLLETEPTIVVDRYGRAGLGYAGRAFRNGTEMIFNLIVRDGLVTHRDAIAPSEWAGRMNSFNWPLPLDEVPWLPVNDN